MSTNNEALALSRKALQRAFTLVEELDRREGPAGKVICQEVGGDIVRALGAIKGVAPELWNPPHDDKADAT